MEKLVEGLLAEMDGMPAIDAHEHFSREEDLAAEPADVLTRLYVSYVIGAAVSAGWKGQREELTDTTVPLRARWGELRPWLPAIADTGVARAAQIAARDLFGIDEINDETYEALSARIQEGNTRGLFRRILHERCKIETVLNVGWPGLVDGEFVRCVYNLWWNLWDLDAGAFRAFYQEWRDCAGGDFEDARTLASFMIERVRGDGCVGLKFSGDVTTEAVGDSAAEGIFAKLKRSAIDDEESRALGTWLVHRLFTLAGEHDLTVAFHCGVGSSDWEDPTLYRATQLIPILMKYRETRFDLYHASQPWVREAAILGHKFPNVHLNLVWAHQMSPFMVERMLNEWIDLVPVNKIIGFGGDNGSAELTYGACQIAKENIARALVARIERGRMTETRAAKVCRMWLYGNAKRVYRL